MSALYIDFQPRNTNNQRLLRCSIFDNISGEEQSQLILCVLSMTQAYDKILLSIISGGSGK